MKTLLTSGRAFALGLCIIATAAYAGSRSGTEVQALTRAAPTADEPTATEYLNLDGLKGFRLCVSAELAQTLSGAGTLQAWVYSHQTTRWHRNPGLDWTQNRSALRDTCFDDQRVSVPTGFVFYAASGVTVSGGTSVTVTLTGIY